jgi:hypothetical protein
MALQGVTRRNVTPITGLGGFDLTLAPVPRGIDVLTVSVRVYVADKRIKPSTSLDDYISNWRGRVAEIWNDKIEFQSKSGDRVKVRFDLQRTASLGGCHFPVELLDGYAQSSGLKFPNANTDPFGGRIYLTLMDQDNLEYHVAAAETLKSGNVGMTPRTIALVAARDAVIGAAPGGQAIFDVGLVKVGNAWSVDPACRPALDAFCAALVNTPNWLVPPPLLIHSSSGLQSKADALADAVKNYILGRGVTAKISTDPVKTKKRFKAPWTPSATTAVVRVEVEGVSEMYKNWKSDYVVSAHEFGHLIGLPDEYLDYSGMTNEAIRKSQPLWDNACKLANVATRNWHGQGNDSIMSLGRRLYPAHAVTILEALDSLMQDHPNRMPAASWTVSSP